MNMLILTGVAEGERLGGLGGGGSSVVFLLIAGLASLAVAAYLLYKAPQPQAVREPRRHPSFTP